MKCELPPEFEQDRSWVVQCQQAQLASLRILAEECHRHNIRFYLEAGTALGAARHHGFIPWDDDVDVNMPRPDYEKLVKLIFSGRTKLQAFEWKNTPGYRMRQMKVASIESGNLDHNYSAMDVFAIDGVPRSKIAVKLQLFLRTFLIQVVQSRYGITNGVKGLLYRLLGIWLPRDERRVHALVEFILRFPKCTWCDSSLVGQRYSPYGIREFVTFDVYGVQGGANVLFENEEYPAPAKLDEYLTAQYGHWRVLPPLEKRLPHHVADDPWFYDQLVTR